MKKKIKALTIFLGTATIVFLMLIIVCRLMIYDFSRSLESQYNNLQYTGMTLRGIKFSCNRYREDEKVVFSPEECLEIEHKYEEKFGFILTFFDLDFILRSSENSVDYAEISFRDYSSDRYKTLFIASTNDLDDMKIISYYSEYRGYEKYIVAGPLIFVGKPESPQDADMSFMQAICGGKELVVDRRTYETRLYPSVIVDDKVVSEFGKIIELNNPVKLNIVDEDLINYSENAESWS